MRRVKCRVANADQLSAPSKSKSMTFDRKTFLECSKIMKGNVSRLDTKKPCSTQQINVQGKQKATCLNVDMGGDPTNNLLSLSSTMEYFVEVEMGTETGTGASESQETEDKIVKKSRAFLSATKNSSFECNGFRIDYENEISDIDLKLDLSENSTTVNSGEVATQIMNRQGEETEGTNCGKKPASTMIQTGTLLAITSANTIRQRIKRKGSHRPVWLKTIQHFVSFMSAISDNVDITSYPTS